MKHIFSVLNFTCIKQKYQYIKGKESKVRNSVKLNLVLTTRHSVEKTNISNLPISASGTQSNRVVYTRSLGFIPDIESDIHLQLQKQNEKK